MENLGVLVKQLWKAGIPEVYIGGSFVEAKSHPNDIGYGRIMGNHSALWTPAAMSWDFRPRFGDRGPARRAVW